MSKIKKIWVHKSDSILDSEKFEQDYYLKMSPSERLDTVQFLRETNIKIRKGSGNEGRKRLRRVLHIIEQQ